MAFLRNASLFKKALVVHVISGIGLPIIMCVLFLSRIGSFPVVRAVLETCNFPAFFFSNLWINSGLPPHGEIKWLVALVVTVFLQWYLLSFIFCGCYLFVKWCRGPRNSTRITRSKNRCVSRAVIRE